VQRIHALDGLRACSILLVSISHFVPMVDDGPIAAASRKLGEPGVTVFFVISGYLITSLLLREAERSGTISLYAFYRRRLLRITPAYVLFLAAVAVFAALGWTRVGPGVWPYLLTYTFNLVPGLDTATVGLVWSLCVEEHFYLLWPATLLLLGGRRAVSVLVGTVFFAAVLRFVLPHHAPTLDVDLFTLTRLDTVAVGCLLAFVEGRTTRARGWPWALLGTAVFFLSIYLFSRSGKYVLGPKYLVEAGAIALVTHALVKRPDDPVTRFLDLAPMRLVGRLSYSLYLAQPVLNAFEALTLTPWVRPLLLAGYAAFSYNVVEKPFLALKDRLERRDRERAGRPVPALAGVAERPGPDPALPSGRPGAT
jgi:peptidoglycan/LPS O-acetylase OafA/YrhL